MKRACLVCAAILFSLCLLSAPALAAEKPYDPLAVAVQEVRAVDLIVKDAARNREIPLKVYLPSNPAPAPVVLFSHGLGGSREGNMFLGKHWASRGYVAVFLQHPGSDVEVWQGKPVADRMTLMKQAASAENYMLRVKDVHAVLDQLAVWNKAGADSLTGRLDLDHIGMSGHSFGAATTQAVGGQSALGGRVSGADPRIKAAVMFSPSAPAVGDAGKAFSTVKIPWLLMTGTKDTSVIGNATVESRLAVFPVLPEGSKYELVLNNAEHSAFSDRKLPGDREPRNPNHHTAILAITTAFWDAYLRGDAAAKTWLDGDGPRAILEKEDRWQKK